MNNFNMYWRTCEDFDCSFFFLNIRHRHGWHRALKFRLSSPPIRSGLAYRKIKQPVKKKDLFVSFNKEKKANNLKKKKKHFLSRIGRSLWIYSIENTNKLLFILFIYLQRPLAVSVPTSLYFLKSTIEWALYNLSRIGCSY